MNWQDDRTMSPKDYRAIIAQLGMSQAAAGRYLGVSPRTAYRYASGAAKLRPSEALLLRALVRYHEDPVVPPWERPYKDRSIARGE